jgi:hypothetical protein
MTRRMKEEPELTEEELAVSMRPRPQGPFLDPLDVHRKKTKPLRPTLRCATDPEDPLRAAYVAGSLHFYRRGWGLESPTSPQSSNSPFPQIT